MASTTSQANRIRNYPTSTILQKSGAVLFRWDNGRPQIYIIIEPAFNSDQFTFGRLPHGDRRAGESRYDAAVRAVKRMSGFDVKQDAKYVVSSKQPGGGQAVKQEPFMMTTERVGAGTDESFNLYCWYVCEKVEIRAGGVDRDFYEWTDLARAKKSFVDFGPAQVVLRAIAVMKQSMGEQWKPEWEVEA